MTIKKFVIETMNELRTYENGEELAEKFEQKFWEGYNNPNMPQSNIDTESDEIDAIPEFAADAFVIAVGNGTEKDFWMNLFGR